MLVLFVDVVVAGEGRVVRNRCGILPVLVVGVVGILHGNGKGLMLFSWMFGDLEMGYNDSYSGTFLLPPFFFFLFFKNHSIKVPFT